MGTLSPTWGPFLTGLEHTMRTLRPKIAVVSGAAIGLIAGAAVYGAVSTSSTMKPASFSTSVTAGTAQCAAGQEFEHGVCVIHLERTGDRSGTSSSSVQATEAREHDGAEQAKDTAEQASELAKEDTQHQTDARG